MAASPLVGAPGCPGRGVLGFVTRAAAVRRDPFPVVGGFERIFRVFVGGEGGRAGAVVVASSAAIGSGWRGFGGR